MHRPATSAASSPSGSVEPGEEAARRARPRHPGGHLGLERAHHHGATLGIQRGGQRDLPLEVACAPVFLDDALRERARALVGELLRPREPGDDVGRAGRPPEPEPGGEDLRERPDLHDDAGVERPQRRLGGAVVGELAVGDVLDDEEPVPRGELDDHAAALARERDAARVLVVGVRVEELRPQPGRERGGERVDVEPVAVDGDGLDAGTVARIGHERAEVDRRLDDDRVAGLEENVIAASWIASMPPLVTRISSSAGARPSTASRRSARYARKPGSPRVGAYWRPAASSAWATSAVMAASASRSIAAGSGKPPANEIRSVRPARPMIAAIASSPPPRARAANRSVQFGSVLVVGSLTRQTLSGRRLPVSGARWVERARRRSARLRAHRPHGDEPRDHCDQREDARGLRQPGLLLADGDSREHERDQEDERPGIGRDVADPDPRGVVHSVAELLAVSARATPPRCA